MRTGGVEPPQREAAGLQPVELTDAQRPLRWGDRPDSNRYFEVHDLGCWPLHHGHQVAGTTGLEPAASRLTSECSARLSYAPICVGVRSCIPVRSQDLTPIQAYSAGGIRTHGLELMRLARTAAPLPRVAVPKSGRQESNLRSPAPEAGGVAMLPYSQKTIR